MKNMTSGEISVLDGSYPVDLDMTGDDMLAVSLGDDGYLDVATTTPILGVLCGGVDGSVKVNVGTVREIGHAKVLADTSSIVVGSPIKVSSGKASLANSPSTDPMLGVALTANSGASIPIVVALRL
jgi:hypothetical protein